MSKKTKRGAEQQAKCESKQYKKKTKPSKQTKNQPNHKANKQTNKKELLLFYEFENEDVFVKVGRVLLQVLCMIWIFALQCQCVKGA